MYENNKKNVYLIVTLMLLLSFISLALPVYAKTQVQEISKLDTKSKIIALTFDDCNSQTNTSAILNVLSENNIKATFFPVGYEVLKNPEIFKKIVDLGNQIGNHSYSHQHFNLLTYDQTADEIDTSEKIIKNATGQSGKPYFRPPFFDYNDLTLQAFENAGYDKMIRFTCDSFDWKGISSDQIVQNVVSNASPGAIILMHDTDNTASALAEIVPNLKNQGYRFVTISELLSYVSVDYISLNSTSVNIEEDQKVDLQTKIYPENAMEKGVVWTSSNKSVAVVDSAGQVEGIAKGSATITAKAVDNGYTATCDIIVSDKMASSLFKYFMSLVLLVTVIAVILRAGKKVVK